MLHLLLMLGLKVVGMLLLHLVRLVVAKVIVRAGHGGVLVLATLLTRENHVVQKGARPALAVHHRRPVSLAHVNEPVLDLLRREAALLSKFSLVVHGWVRVAAVLQKPLGERQNLALFKLSARRPLPVRALHAHVRSLHVTTARSVDEVRLDRLIVTHAHPPRAAGA